MIKTYLLRLDVDAETDLGYVYLDLLNSGGTDAHPRRRGIVHRSSNVGPVVLDYDRHGQLVGIELLTVPPAFKL